MREKIMKKFRQLVALFWALVFAAVSYDAEAQWLNQWTSNKTAGSVSASAFPLLAPDGLVGAPSYAFSGSPNTGMYRSAANQAPVLVYAGTAFLTNDINFGGRAEVSGLGWTSSLGTTSDIVLERDAADALAQRRGTNAQAFRVYNTYTDASNNEYGQLQWAANAFNIGTVKNGTGGSRNVNIIATNHISFQAGSFNSWQISAAAGYLLALSDNLYDIGASGANRPRSIYAATSLNVPQITAGSGNTIALSGFSTNPIQLRTSQSTVPTCSSGCGTGSGIVGSDTAGIITMGGSGVPASPFTVTFNGTWSAAPSCVAQSALAGMVVGKMPITVVTTTTTMVVTTNGTAPATSDKYAYHCIGV
jgi:hypothetical protein